MKVLFLVAILVAYVSTRDLPPGVDPRCQFIPTDIVYLFYSLKNPDVPIIIASNETNLIKRTHFDPAKDTLVLVHGSGGNSSGPLVQKTRAAMAKAKLDINLLGMDWRRFQTHNAKINSYTCADYFGILVGNFLKEMVRGYKLDLGRTTMTGHSIAGRFMSHAGQELGGKLRSIIGLETCVMERTDAKFVECMYTNRGPDAKPKAHANFYPNGGANQSHCDPADWGCSHWRACDFYAESITTQKFVSRQCPEWTDYKAGKCNKNPTAFMGGIIPDTKAFGKYYLHTNPDPPYAMG